MQDYNRTAVSNGLIWLREYFDTDAYHDLDGAAMRHFEHLTERQQRDLATAMDAVHTYLKRLFEVPNRCEECRAEAGEQR